MATKDVLKMSAEQKTMADKILAESKLLEILGKYGTTQVVGSYSYDLMTAPDIDVHVLVPELSKAAVMAAFNKLMSDNYFYAYKIADFYEKAKRPGIDRGFLIGLRYWTPEAKWNTRWKFDIWFLEQENPHQKAIAQMIHDRITPGKRLDILRLKDWRDHYNTGIEAYHIYKAVLENDVKTPDELMSYMETTKQNH